MVGIADLITGGRSNFRPATATQADIPQVDGVFKPILEELMAKYPDLKNRMDNAILGIESPQFIFYQTCPVCGVSQRHRPSIFCSDECAKESGRQQARRWKQHARLTKEANGKRN